MTSMFNQLHCLQMIQEAYVEHIDPGSGFKVGRTHIEHCFSYLRQGVQCAGDSTLEGPGFVDGKNVGALHGWNIAHTCRNWTEMKLWMDEHKP
jgi:hypothetical protein